MSGNSIFKNNMSALEQKYPDLAENVRQCKPESSKYKVMKTKTGEPNIVIVRDLDYVMLYDNDRPFEYCKRFFDGLNMRYAPITVFLGLGLGYHLQLFLDNYGKRLGAKKIIIFEKDCNLFRLALQMVDLQQIIKHSEIHLLVGDDIEDAYVKIRTEILHETPTINQIRSTKIIPLPSHILLDRQYYLKALDSTKKAFRQLMVLSGNDPLDSFLGLNNVLENIENIVSTSGINRLFDKFKDRPAVTVASGPSLNKNMHLLKDLSERALIVCCDASLLPLMRQNIRPDIVVTMERTDGTEYFYEKVPDFEDMYLAFCPLVRPKTFESFKGKKVIVHRPFSHFEWLQQDKGTLAIGPSVGNMAFKVAEVLGCNPIILVGQDLAFAADGDTHVKDMPFGERDDFYHENVLEVEGNDGNPIKTSRAWEVFKKSFEEDIYSYSGLCINATEGGAKIIGAEVMLFSEALEKYCQDTFSPTQIIEEAITDFNKDLDVRGEMEQFLPRIRDTRASLKELIEEFKELHDQIRRTQKETIIPFINEGVEVDKEAIEALVEKTLDLLESYLKDQNVKDIMMHTLQPLSLWFNNRFNFLHDVYSDRDCLRSAQMLMIKEWAGTVGQLLVSTVDSLNKAEEILVERIPMVS